MANILFSASAPPPPSLNVTITHTGHMESVAPSMRHFTATVTGTGALPVQVLPTIYDEQFHRYTFVWDFGHTRQTYRSEINLPDIFNKRNVAYGRNVATTFDEAGTFTVTCTVYDEDRVLIAQNSINVTVQDTQTAYPGGRTILVDPAGQADAAHPGATVVTTLGAAVTAMDQADTCCVLVKRGTTWNDVAVNILNAKNIHWGAYGAGADPIYNAFDHTASVADRDTIPFFVNKRYTGNDITFAYIDVRGSWDSTREYGVPKNAFYTLEHGSVEAEAEGFTGDCALLYHAVTMDGFSKTQPGHFRATGDPTYNTHFGFSECKTTNWQDYAVLTAQMPTGVCKLGVVGCDFSQKSDAAQGRLGVFGGKDRFTNDHSGLRFANMDWVYVGSYSGFARNDWSGSLANPSLRPESEGGQGHHSLAMLAINGGFLGIDANRASGSAGREDSPINFRILNAIIHFSPCTWGAMQCSYAPGTYENILIVRRTAIHQGQNGFSEIFNLEADNPAGGIYDQRFRWRNVQVFDVSTDGDTVPATLTQTAGWTDLTNTNEVRHSLPNSLDADIDETTTFAGWDASYAGGNESIENLELTGQTVADNGTCTFSTYPAGTAQGDFLAGNDHVVYANGTYWFRENGEIALTFNAGNIVVQNLSGETWSGDVTLHAMRTTISLDTQFALTANAPEGRPEIGGVSDGTATGIVPLVDLEGTMRVGSTCPGVWHAAI